MRSAPSAGGLRTTKRDGRTLAAALREFVDGMRAGTVRPKNRERYKPNTVRSYDQHLRLRISSSPLGRLKITEVQRRDVQAFVDRLLAEGLSPATVNNALNPVQAFYGRAEDRGEVSHNPTERIDIPAGPSQRPTRVASAKEAVQLLEVLRGPDQPLWATAFYAGLRRGELQALRCCDVDLAASLVRIEHALNRCKNQLLRSQRRAGGPCRSRRFCAITLTSTCCAPGVGERSCSSGEMQCSRSWPLASITGRRSARKRSGCGDHPARVPAHIRLAFDRRRRQPQGDPDLHGSLENPDDLRHLRSPVARQSR